jgi:universal stress protein A
MIAIRKILVPVDFSETSDVAVTYGRHLAQTFDAQLILLHIVDDLAARIATTTPGYIDLSKLQGEMEQSARSRLGELGDDPARTRAALVTANPPAPAIVDYATDAKVDLIVMGTHGRSGVAHLFLGSVAERVVRSAPCPVLTVRQPEPSAVRKDSLEAIQRTADGAN